MKPAKDLILASGSKGRAAVLSGAGFSFETIISHVDEDELKLKASAQGKSLDETALLLAHEKAKVVSAKTPGFVIGADQIMGLAGKGFDKPTSMAAAKERLALFSGKTHLLHTALVVYENGNPVFAYSCAPALRMRKLSDEEIDAYLSSAGEEVLATVGAYMLESHGARLFEEIEGDYFSILGLPLLPLIAFLRPRLELEF